MIYPSFFAGKKSELIISDLKGSFNVQDLHVVNVKLRIYRRLIFFQTYHVVSITICKLCCANVNVHLLRPIGRLCFLQNYLFLNSSRVSHSPSIDLFGKIAHCSSSYNKHIITTLNYNTWRCFISFHD